MSKTKKILPDLRFPEFSNNETWADRKLSDVLFEHKEKSTGNEEVYSVSVHKGVVNQVEHLGRVFAASNTENYKRVLPGDIIYTKSPTGDFPFGIIKQSKVSKPVIVSPLYGVFKPETTDLGVILDAYFEYPERTINYLSSIVQKGAKNTINIHNDTFLSKSLVLPLDKKEQRKIASCLSSLDDVITTHIEKLDLLKDHKKGLMQNLFPQENEKVPKYRFKEYRNSGNWNKKKLNEICEVNPSSKGLPEKFIYIDLESVEDGILKQKKHISISEAPSRAQRFLIKDDVIFQTVRPYQQNNYYFLPDDSFNYVASTGYAQLRAYESPSFLYQYIHNPNFLEKVLAKCTGSNYPAINSSDLSEITVLIPSKIQEQQKIAFCLSALDEIIKAQLETIEQLKQHKKGLMQRLLPKATD